MGNRQDWKIHLVKHTGDTRPFKCEICGHGFPRKQQRDVHMSTHTGDKSHLCPTCGAAFGSLSSLIDHKKRTHQGRRDHKCTQCEKGFFNKHELNVHLRTHTKERPFVCRDCGKAFSRPHHLNRHLVSVHAAKCGQCKTKCSHVKPEPLMPEPQIVIIQDDQHILAKDVIEPITFTKDQVVAQGHTIKVLEHSVTVGGSDDELIAAAAGATFSSPRGTSNSREADETKTQLLAFSPLKEMTNEPHTVRVDDSDVASSLLELSQSHSSAKRDKLPPFKREQLIQVGNNVILVEMAANPDDEDLIEDKFPDL